PVLALAGPAPRRLLGGHVLSAVLALPLLGLILDNRENVAAGARGPSLGLLGGGVPSFALPFFSLSLAYARAWRRLSLVRRVLVAHSAAVIATLLLLPLAVQVRFPATLFALSAVAPTLACAAISVVGWAASSRRRQAVCLAAALVLAVWMHFA